MARATRKRGKCGKKQSGGADPFDVPTVNPPNSGEGWEEYYLKSKGGKTNKPIGIPTMSFLRSGGRKHAATRRTKHKHTKTCKHARRGAKKSGHKKRKHTRRGRKHGGGFLGAMSAIGGDFRSAMSATTCDTCGPGIEDIGGAFGSAVTHPCKANPSLCP